MLHVVHSTRVMSFRTIGDEAMTDGETVLVESKENRQLSDLRQEHRRLDAEIEALQLQGEPDLKVMTLKRKKLQIKDEIAWMMTRLRPDIIA